jgi:hypothetical protein
VYWLPPNRRPYLDRGVVPVVSSLPSGKNAVIGSIGGIGTILDTFCA